MFKEGQKVYWVKYALTSGIQEREIESTGMSDDIWGLKNRPGECGCPFCYSSELFSNLDDAVAEAERMRKKKINSLKKKINKIENMEFKIV